MLVISISACVFDFLVNIVILVMTIFTIILLCIDNCRSFMIHQCFITLILCVTEDKFPFLICF